MLWMTALRGHLVGVSFIVGMVLFFCAKIGEKEEVEEKKDTYVVTFIDSINESTISEVTVEEGSDAALPEAPTHEGYFFKEWEGNKIKKINLDCPIF